MKKAVVCLCLLRLPELPCYEILNNPVTSLDSGRTYLCEKCRATMGTITPEQCAVICEEHCDAMTVIESTDARKGDAQ